MSLVKMLLWGNDEAEHGFAETSPTEDNATWNEEPADLDAGAIADSWQTPGAYDPVESIRRTLEREAAEVRERDALAARVGNLSLAVESLLRLLKDKAVITDLDLRHMQLQVDLEDGHADGEYHPGQSPVPSHCPMCEARIPSGKRLCQLCGHHFPAE